MFFARDQVRIHDTWYTRRTARQRAATTSRSPTRSCPRAARCGSARGRSATGPLYRFPRLRAARARRLARSRSASRAARSTSWWSSRRRRSRPAARATSPSRSVVQRQVGGGRGGAALRAGLRVRRDRLGLADRIAGEVAAARATRAELRLAAANAAWSAARAVDLAYHAGGRHARCTTRARCRAAFATSTSPPNT